MGQLVTALGVEPGGTTNRLNEQFGYAYDTAGNLNFRTNNALVQTFNVNSLNELTTNTRSGTLTVAGTTTGPATNVTVNTSNAVLYSDSTFASANQSLANGNNTFTAIAKDNYGRQDSSSVTVNLPATNVYTYDLNGNLTSDGTRGFDYDDESQLIRVTVTNAWKSEFVYDARMRRRIRREYKWTSTWVQTNEVHYVYDGNLVLQERDQNNVPQVSYTRGRDLSRGLQGAGGIGGLLARSDNRLLAGADPGAHVYYHADANGNITCLVNTNQAIVAKYLYDPYGNVLSQSGSLAEANLYRFSSKESHVNSGLVYYGYRLYDPNLQRWPNRDPIAELGGKNLYAFAGNSPQTLVDPLGLCDPDQLQNIQRQIDLWQKYLNNLPQSNMTDGNFSQVSQILQQLKEQRDALLAGAGAAASTGAAGIISGVFSAPTLTGAGGAFTGFGVTGATIAGGAVVGVAAAGAAVGYGISQIPVGGGQNVSDVLGGWLYALCPRCF
jgi:RHS repeat-associated protein